VLTFSDRYFLNHFSTTAEVGIYALAYRFSFALSAFAVAPFGLVWEPRRFEVAKRPDAGQIYRRMFFYLSLALIGGAAAMTVLVEDVLHVMSAPEFWPAHMAVPLILVATILQQWTTYCNLGIYLRDRTDLYAWAAVIGVVVVLGLNALLIPRYGMMGAAWATVAAYAVRFVIVYVISQRLYHIAYPWRKVGLLAFMFAGVYGLRSLAQFDAIMVSVGFSLALLAAAGLLVVRFLLTNTERRAIAELLLRSRRRQPVAAG
jgi:O-antigen/teichoic acid export membrane protein